MTKLKVLTLKEDLKYIMHQIVIEFSPSYLMMKIGIFFYQGDDRDCTVGGGDLKTVFLIQGQEVAKFGLMLIRLEC